MAPKSKDLSKKMATINDFKSLVKKHVITIVDTNYVEYLEQGNVGNSISPSFDKFRGFGLKVSRENLVEKACSVGGISPTDYFNDLLSKPYEVIGSLLDAPVYFFPEMGVYAAALNENEIVEVWLSWSTYPKGW